MDLFNPQDIEQNPSIQSTGGAQDLTGKYALFRFTPDKTVGLNPSLMNVYYQQLYYGYLVRFNPVTQMLSTTNFKPIAFSYFTSEGTPDIGQNMTVPMPKLVKYYELFMFIPLELINNTSYESIPNFIQVISCNRVGITDTNDKSVEFSLDDIRALWKGTKTHPQVTVFHPNNTEPYLFYTVIQLDSGYGDLATIGGLSYYKSSVMTSLINRPFSSSARSKIASWIFKIFRRNHGII